MDVASQAYRGPIATPWSGSLHRHPSRGVGSRRASEDRADLVGAVLDVDGDQGENPAALLRSPPRGLQPQAIAPAVVDRSPVPRHGNEAGLVHGRADDVWVEGRDAQQPTGISGHA